MSRAGWLLALMLLKATTATDAARKNGCPLLFTTEPDEQSVGRRWNPDQHRGIN